MAHELDAAGAPPDPSRTSDASAQPPTLGADGINIRDIRHVFWTPSGQPVEAVANITFHIPGGQFTAIVGPSGCGKTTVLNMLAGLVSPSSGHVEIHGERVSGPSRSIGYMFARDGLMPWRTATRNIEYGLEIRGVDRQDRRDRARQLLEQVGLMGFADAYPKQLSHGMRQRVALARTLAFEPDILLLDEPFAALDAQTKQTLQDLFLNTWQESAGKTTVVLVTHDLQEAVALADTVVVFSARPGRIKAIIEVPIDRPRQLDKVTFERSFRETAAQVWEVLRDEVKTASE